MNFEGQHYEHKPHFDDQVECIDKEQWNSYREKPTD
jgi:hypothetical protein